VVLNKSELASAFQVSTNTISNWMVRGCPHRSTGRPGMPVQFKWKDVEEWCYLYKTWPDHRDPDIVIGTAYQRARKIVAARVKIIERGSPARCRSRPAH
jgi:hypothetical protein